MGVNMNKAQIKAELRRSACEDELPFLYVSNVALYAASNYCGYDQWINQLSTESIRTFYLLVAEAL